MSDVERVSGQTLFCQTAKRVIAQRCWRGRSHSAPDRVISTYATTAQSLASSEPLPRASLHQADNLEVAARCFSGMVVLEEV